MRIAAVGGAPAVVFTVDSCGSDNENLTMVRLAVLHDGFGLIAFTETKSGEEDADIDRLIDGPPVWNGERAERAFNRS